MYDRLRVLGLAGQLGDSCLYGRLEVANLLLMSLKTSVVLIGQLLLLPLLLLLSLLLNPQMFELGDQSKLLVHCSRLQAKESYRYSKID